MPFEEYSKFLDRQIKEEPEVEPTIEDVACSVEVTDFPAEPATTVSETRTYFYITSYLLWVGGGIPCTQWLFLLTKCFSLNMSEVLFKMLVEVIT